MPINDLQRAFRELGRLRLGQQVEGRNGKTRPEKLDTWRLTSDSETILTHAAQLYGGTVERWAGETGDDFQLVTETAALDIIIPPGQALTQWNEMWGSGGCLRRCDGDREMLAMQPCLCPADPADRNELASKGEACKPTSRLSVILPKLPDLGVWVLVSHGYYAAVELSGSVALLQAAREAGRLTPAMLVISHRSIKRQGQPRKDIVVPAISIPDTMDALMAGAGALAITAGDGRPAMGESASLPADPSFGASARGFAIPTDAVMPLTSENLTTLINDSRVSLEYAADVFHRMYPDCASTKDLTDLERGALWKEIAEPPNTIPATPDATAATETPAEAAEATEAPSEALFPPLDDEERTAVGGGLAG